MKVIITPIQQKDEWPKIEAENEQQQKIWYDNYKQEKRHVLSETILSLLVDLPQERIYSLLEEGMPEELVDWCKKIYDKEFDLNLGDLGVVRAHEIAWQEALGIFADTSD